MTGVLRAILVLLGLWATLALAAWVAGVLPSFDFGAHAAQATGGADAKDAPEGAAPGDHAASAPDGPGADAAAGAKTTPSSEGAQDAATAPRPTRRVHRYTACEPTVERPSIATASVVGDPRPEILLGCGRVVHVLSFVRDVPVPMRVATLDVTTEGSVEATHAAAPAAGDVDGDSLPDLVLGFWHARRDGSTQGGALYLVRRDAAGGFLPPRKLAPVAAVDLLVAQLDGRPGLDIAALHRANALARRPSELWVFAGGASPSRTASVPTGVHGEEAAAGDLDGDGERDLVTASSGDPRVDVFLGDGTGRYGQTLTVAVAEPREIRTGDLDGNGRVDALVRGKGLHLLTATDGTLQVTPLEAPPDLHSVHLADVDGDGLRDVVGIQAGRIVALRQVERLELETRELVDMTQLALGLWDLDLSDLDSDGRSDLVVLARSPGERGWELVIAYDVGETGIAEGPAAPENVPDAPLRLQVALR